MATATITMRTDSVDKSVFEGICADIGISVNTALNIFVKRVVRDHKIPFELSADPFFSDPNMRYLRGSAAAARAGKVVEHDLIEV